MATSGIPRRAAAMFLLLLPAAAGTMAVTPSPQHSDRYQAYADVVRVSPRYGWHPVSEPVRECVDVTAGARIRQDRYGYDYPYSDNYRERLRGGAGAALLGGLIGGLIGHQFGDGNGRTALTVAGAALGASVARDRALRRADPYGDPVRRCTTSSRMRQVRGVDGYDVTYRYRGQTFHKWMDTHPGERIAVQVAVEPLGLR